MRNAFADEITILGKEMPELLLLVGDIGNRLFDLYKASQGDRFFNCGIAEANMISVGAGLALTGFRPVCYTITPFITARCLEQIRVDVCYHEAPVVIVGVGAGLSYANNGATHHSCEDIAMLRCLPNMSVVCPSDPTEVRLALRAAVLSKTPVYLRLGKKGERELALPRQNFTIGEAQQLASGTDIALLGCGTIVPTMLDVADRLRIRGLTPSLWNFHTVKPIDRRSLQGIFQTHKLVVTVEEHSHLGGFGSAVSECASELVSSAPRILRLGTSDSFLHEGGEQEHARKLFGLDVEQLEMRIVEGFARTLRNEPFTDLVNGWTSVGIDRR